MKCIGCSFNEKTDFNLYLCKSSPNMKTIDTNFEKIAYTEPPEIGYVASSYCK